METASCIELRIELEECPDCGREHEFVTGYLKGPRGESFLAAIREDLVTDEVLDAFTGMLATAVRALAKDASLPVVMDAEPRGKGLNS